MTFLDLMEAPVASIQVLTFRLTFPWNMISQNIQAVRDGTSSDAPIRSSPSTQKKSQCPKSSTVVTRSQRKEKASAADMSNKTDSCRIEV